MVVKKIGTCFFLKIFKSSIFAFTKSSQEKPNGDRGSINPLHISTTTSAGELPEASFADASKDNYLVLNAGDSGAGSLV